MSYYKLLGFEKEPFSTSPDPNFFYLSKEHDLALTNILIELRLKRGLTAVLGDIGTGKTTLSRKLIYEMRQRKDFMFYMLLYPYFTTETLFLTALMNQLGISLEFNQYQMSDSDRMELIEKFLLEKAVHEGKTLTLIIDEAQKVTESTLETLRIFLNFETNEYKLLQVVMLGQLELVPKILNLENFYDRISMKYVLNPFNFEDTRNMILFRVSQAGYISKQPLFEDGAIEEICRHTKGYPRRITMLCHKALKQLILKKKHIVDQEMIRDLIDSESQILWQKEPSLLKKSYLS